MVFRGNLARDAHNGIDEIATIPTKFDDSRIYTRDVANLLWMYKSGLERSLVLIEELERKHKEVEFANVRGASNPASTISIVNSLKEQFVFEIMGEYIPGYQEL